MKTFTFRVTQDLRAFYEGEVSIEALNEQDARKKLAKLSTKKLDEIATHWEQNTDNATPEGKIEIQELISEE